MVDAWAKQGWGEHSCQAHGAISNKLQCGIDGRNETQVGERFIVLPLNALPLTLQDLDLSS